MSAPVAIGRKAGSEELLEWAEGHAERGNVRMLICVYDEEGEMWELSYHLLSREEQAYLGACFSHRAVTEDG